MRRPTLAACLAAAVGAALGAPAAHGASFVFTPAADAFTKSSAPSANFGASRDLRTDASPTLRSYLRFDIRGLDAPVSSAELQLDAGDTATAPLEVRPVADNAWGERTVTHDNAPVPGAPVAVHPAGVAADPVRLDATALVAGDGLVSMAITSPSSIARKFASREVSARSPRLVVETSSPEWPLLAAAGDISCDPLVSAYKSGAGTSGGCAQTRTSDLMIGRPLEAVLPLGDLQYPRGQLDKFSQAYDPSWGRFKAISRPVAGNHEYGTAGAAGYFDYFNGLFALNGPAGTRAEGYYSYELGSWHVIALNSNCAAVGGCGEGSPQNDWLEADLAAHPSSCILAYWHHPRFTSGQHADDTGFSQPFWPDLYAAGADVVLNGHDHIYERFGRQDPAGQADPDAGIREFIVGTGGKSHYAPASVAANSGVRDSTSFGVLELRLLPDRYSWRFVPESRSSFTDAGTDVCAGSTVDSEPPTMPTGVAGAAGLAQVDLSWAASSDNDGVASYRILRDGIEVGTSTTAKFTDTTVAAGQTYSYRVIALDGVGNESPASAPVELATPSGSVLRFRPIDDATVLEGSPGANYGAATSLQVDSTPREEFLLRFAVSGIGSHAIRTVALELDPTNPSGAGGAIHQAAASWEEESIAWLTAPAVEGPALASVGSVVAGTRKRVALGAAVTGDGTYAFRVVGQSSDGADYASDEAGAATAPQLVIEID